MPREEEEVVVREPRLCLEQPLHGEAIKSMFIQSLLNLFRKMRPEYERKESSEFRPLSAPAKSCVALYLCAT